MFFSKVYICSLLFYYYILVFNSDLQILIWPFQNVLDKNSFRFFFIYLFFFYYFVLSTTPPPLQKKKRSKKSKIYKNGKFNIAGNIPLEETISFLF